MFCKCFATFCFSFTCKNIKKFTERRPAANYTRRRDHQHNCMSTQVASVASSKSHVVCLMTHRPISFVNAKRHIRPYKTLVTCTKNDEFVVFCWLYRLSHWEREGSVDEYESDGHEHTSRAVEFPADRELSWVASLWTPSTTHDADRRRASAVLKISELHDATDPVERHAANHC